MLPVETVGATRQRISQTLQDCTETPQLDADLLLGHVLRHSRLQLLSASSEQLSAEAFAEVEDLVSRRCAGEPIAYITGQKMFRSINLVVDSRVLVPRPETEQLVEIALQRIRSSEKYLRVIDIGTGSGAIALAIAEETQNMPDRMSIAAGDVSTAALDVATLNRNRLGLVDRVTLSQSSLLDGAEGQFDLILANLPYLRPDQAHWSTSHEPSGALFSGEDGFDLYRELINQLPVYLAPDGLFIGEIDPSQAFVGVQELEQVGNLDAWVARDLSGSERFLIGESRN